jgi:hypothetical protein
MRRFPPFAGHRESGTNPFVELCSDGVLSPLCVYFSLFAAQTV